MVRRLSLAAILSLGLALRLGGLHYGLPSKNRALTTYHPDEPKSYYCLERMNPAKFDLNPRDGLFWGSLHLYALGFALEAAKVAGYVHAPSRQYLIDHLHQADRLYIVGRLLSVAAGTAAIFLLYLAGLRLGGPAAGFLAAGMLALAPVHIVNSFVVRPDILMLLFAVAALQLSLRFIDEEDRKSWVWASLCAGLAAATKYNGGLFLVCPWIAVFLKKGWCRELIWIPALAFAAFVAGCPYALIEFHVFMGYMRENAALAQEGLSSVIYGPGWLSYWTTFLPDGLSAPVSGSALAGVVWALAELGRRLKPAASLQKTAVLFMSGLIVYAATVQPRHQMVWYTLPVVPFCLLFAARFWTGLWEYLHSRGSGWIAAAAAAIVLVWLTADAFATVSLYRGKNVREEASEWIEAHVPPGSTVAVARKYFWTPGILRQYHPPYRLAEGGDDQSVLPEAVLGLEQAAGRADFLVLTELETRDFLHPKMRDIFPAQAGVLDRLTTRDFREVARFERGRRFFGGGDFPPDDWIYPDPVIRIYRRVRPIR